MSLPVATALRPRGDRLWPAVVVSAALHAAVVVWALARERGPEIDLGQKPIAAKLVRLGERRPEQFLPRKEAPPPAPAAAPLVSAPSPSIAAATVPAAPVPGARPAPPAPTSTGTSSADRASRIASVLSAQRQRADDEPRWGAPDGDPLGDSEDGAEGDRYLAEVVRALQASYQAPATISDRDRLHLKAAVVLYIEPDGRLTRWRLETPSGNSAFDAYVQRTLTMTQRLPRPPDAVREQYRTKGVAVIFTAAAL